MTGSSRTRGEQVLLALCIVPPLLLVVLTFIYCVDLPQIDEWRFIPDMEKTFAGTLTFEDLWRQHNEHRILFPKAVILFLAWMSHWNTRWGSATSIVLAFAIFWLIVATFREVLAPFSARPSAKAVLAVSIIVFSFNQWQNWLWGMELIIFMCIAAVLATVALLSRRDSTAAQFAAAIGSAVVATYSFGSGLLVWPLGGLIIAASREASRVRRMIVWTVAGLAAVALYFHGLDRSPALQSVAAVAQPLQFIRYVLIHVGAPMVSFSGSARPPRDSGVAVWVGAIGIIAVAVLTYRILGRKGLEFRLAATILAGLALFEISNAMLTAFARLQMGVPQAFASRYVTVSQLFWIALIGLVELSRVDGISMEKRAPHREWSMVIWPILALAMVSSALAVPKFRERYRLLAPVRIALATCDVDRTYGLLTKPYLIPRGLGVMRFRGLSALRGHAPLDCTDVAPPTPLTVFSDLLALERPVRSFEAGETITVPLRVTNPTIEAWPNADDRSGRFGVYMSYRWSRGNEVSIPTEPPLTALPYPLFPGRSMIMNMDVLAPSEPGEYTLSVDLMQKGVGWFGANGAVPLTLPIEIRRAPVSQRRGRG